MTAFLLYMFGSLVAFGVIVMAVVALVYFVESKVND